MDLDFCHIPKRDTASELFKQLGQLTDDIKKKFAEKELDKGLEPMTAFTDAVLAAWTLFLAAFLFSRANGRRPVRLWAWAFVFTAITALAGVFYHACRVNLSLTQTAIAWKMVPFSTGASMFCFGWAAALVWLGPKTRRWAVALLILVMAGCLVWAIPSNSFAVTIVESLPVLFALLIGSLMHWSDRASRWIAAGVVVSLFAAVIQASEIFCLEKLGPFDKNDVFHLVMLPANYFLFRGGLLLEEWRAR